MYDSPITVTKTAMETEYENGILKAVQNVGFDVNKEELAKALMYDRKQYEKGYADAKAEYNEWIPCEEQLPVKNGAYFVTQLGFPDNDVCEAIYCRKWLSIVGDEIDVIAWMPLPEPWKGADDE